MPFSTTIWPPPAQSTWPTSRTPFAELILSPLLVIASCYGSATDSCPTMEEAMATRRDMFRKLAVFGSLATLATATSAKAQALRKRFIKRERPEQSGYSLAVITEGAGRTIWLAGQTGAVDASGKSLAGDIDAQVRQ